MTLSGKQRQFLRALAHHKPVVVTIGAAGATGAVTTELNQALQHHELIKIKLPEIERATRRQILEQLCGATGAALIQEIGRVGVLYRAAEPPRLELP